MTPIDQKDQGMQGERERCFWKALSITVIVTQKLEVEERGGDGKVRGKSGGERKERGKRSMILTTPMS